MDELIESILADLKAELEITDSNLNETLLEIKVKAAANEVKLIRKYPSTYTDTMIASDMADYYYNIRNIALYDYLIVGDEFQTQSTENSVSRSWVDRSTLFAGVLPLAKF